MTSGRLRSLDVFRGATIAGMILVNNAGNEAQTWWPLLHAEWHGWTPTDWIFPFFLFIVGVAIAVALGEPQVDLPGDPAARRALHGKILRRAGLIFLVGLLLTWYPFYTVDWSRARIPGVLQRISVVYLLAALAYLHLRPRGRLVLGAGLLLGYWSAMTLVPVPGFGAGDLGVQGNLAAWLDHQVLGSHIWRYAPGPGDPEGLLSTLPALVTALLGIAAGEALRLRPVRLGRLAVAGAVLLAAGIAWGTVFPINKNLWTSSYVLATGGFALFFLAATVWLVDHKGWTTWARPFETFGKNSLATFVGSSLMAKTFFAIKWPGPDGAPLSLKGHLYPALFGETLPGPFASLAWALCYVLIWWAIAAWLERRRVFVRL